MTDISIEAARPKNAGASEMMGAFRSRGTQIEGIVKAFQDLESENRRLRVQNEQLRLAGNELAQCLKDVSLLAPLPVGSIKRWEEALRL